MYNYCWDSETGGIIFSKQKSNTQREVRPVFHEELNAMGFNRFWKYSDCNAPYMWCQEYDYYYRGKKVLTLAPIKRIEDEYKIVFFDESTRGMTLLPVDLGQMEEKNRVLMDCLKNKTLKIIYDSYIKYKDDVDIVYVGYSGGKDSIVMLDLVKRVLPPDAYYVMHSDSGMDYKSMTQAAEKERETCRKNGIRFISAIPEFDAEKLWKTIGPPSRPNRWCCPIQQATVTRMAIRKLTQKPDYRSLSYMGNRALESVNRSRYDYISEDFILTKDTVCNAVLDWSSAEVFQYIFMNKLGFNEAYRKGARRMGCVVCPMATARGTKFALENYPEETEKWAELIVNSYDKHIDKECEGRSVLSYDKWNSRNGSAGTVYKPKHREYIKNEVLHIELFDKEADWRVWMKTIGVLTEEGGKYSVCFNEKKYTFDCIEKDNTLLITLEDRNTLKDDKFIRMFRTVFIKAAYCIGCHVCEVECPKGCLIMKDGRISITDDCNHCGLCNSRSNICYVYRSMYLPDEVLE